ncbi:hypothetical protein CHLRE_07g314833v5 [Chlamydomonas reinhardtii]|uniref:Uncharacterized protein n=1 Tax=Chlamydomonas reinhardtii TaxID=3055 RepID=A0A2K3DIK5_CHLRE|nr:uncharacterized protein CHLRE_07g314833v5 [Chlamydomonas reinhardtii]PNW80373.1 hypothetical protein CHLRE_07g314833v5 [Chlamydomonas reinhardtii]
MRVRGPGRYQPPAYEELCNRIRELESEHCTAAASACSRRGGVAALKASNGEMSCLSLVLVKRLSNISKHL